MARHELTATRETVVNVFDRDTPAVLTVDAGDVVVVDSLDAAGYLEPLRTPGETPPTMFGDRSGHCLTGPIAVRGAEPGMVLEVRFDSLTTGSWGWTRTGVNDTPLTRRLGVADGPATSLLWDIDEQTATNDRGHTVDVAPFLGVVGVPPVEPGPHSTFPPRAGSGGNVDCRELVAGSTLYLPVTVPGALLHLGDGHAAQGNGEVAGTAIECQMTTEVTLNLRQHAPVPGLHAETPEGWVTFGFDENLNTATGDALDAMLTWMASLFDLDRTTALALAGAVVDLRITQVAGPTFGVHAVLPYDAIH
ncbi:acetamidase/formamidase family protein [Kribbella sp. NPDC026611]|uniref:acetamidase/formamidase family protein n=1 Tax=Kribbella sp. NPDC026611 TaxID=3154911 RepID=UPI0033C678B0